MYRDFKANVELHVTNTGIAIKMTNQVNNPFQTSRLYYLYVAPGFGDHGLKQTGIIVLCIDSFC